MQTDVFLSYAREDLSIARFLAEALSENGLSVWWDRNMPAGENLDAYIERMLHDARRVVVLWSKESVGSRWVQAEADFAAQRNILLPIIIDDCQPPLSFRQIHATFLKDWQNDEGEVDFSDLASVISPLVKNPAPEFEAEAMSGDRELEDLFRQLLEGIVELMREVAVAKMKHSHERTIIGRSDNNPIKFAADTEQVIKLLTSKKRPGWMGATDAIEDAFRSIKGHQAALLQGNRAALETQTRAYDPDRLAETFNNSRSALDWLRGGSAARNWQLYCEHYRTRKDEIDERAMTAFEKAYKQAIDG